MKAPIGNLRGLISSGEVGPWPCEACGNVTQFAVVSRTRTVVQCLYENCNYRRMIDKVHNIIRENDGTWWRFDNDGNKTRIAAQ